jgi:hypothetical protein
VVKWFEAPTWDPAEKRPLDVESERPTSRLAPLEWMAKLEPPTRDPPKERAEKPPPPPT